jgi:hypothetical protein
VTTLAVFWTLFGATVLAMAAALASGWTRRRRLHLVAAPCALLLLAAAIVAAEALGAERVLPQGPLRIHLVFAKAGALLGLPVLATGIWLLRNPRARAWHLTAVLVFLAGVLAATATGIWMFAQSTPR